MTACLKVRVYLSLYKHCPKNSTLVSWAIQNQIIIATGEVMRDSLVKDINADPFFTIMSDGTTDTATLEQMTIVIRYVKDHCLHEAFLGFAELNSITGEGIVSAPLRRSPTSFGFQLRECDFLKRNSPHT